MTSIEIVRESYQKFLGAMRGLKKEQREILRAYDKRLSQEQEKKVRSSIDKIV
jgi:hypothetical protein